MTEGFFAIGLVARLTLVLSIAWLVHLAIAKANPRWRVLTWRLAAVALVVVGIVALTTPTLSLAVLPAEITRPLPASEGVPMSPVASHNVEERLIANSNAEPSAVPVNNATEIRGGKSSAISAQPDSLRAATAMRIDWHWLVFAIWLSGVALGCLRSARAWLQLRNLRTRSLPADRKIVELGDTVARRLNLQASFEIRETNDVPSPCVFGLLRPVILLPSADCQPEQRTALPAILAHEIAHLANNDVLWHSALHALSRLLWFRPLLWRVPAAHLAACDAACDATAASYIGDVAGYGQLLAQMALRIAGTSPRPALQMARASSVRRRIEALHQRLHTQPLSPRGLLVTTTITLLFASCCGALSLARAQATAKVDLYGDALLPGASARLGTIRFQHASGQFLRLFRLIRAPVGW